MTAYMKKSDLTSSTGSSLLIKSVEKN